MSTLQDYTVLYRYKGHDWRETIRTADCPENAASHLDKPHDYGEWSVEVQVYDEMDTLVLETTYYGAYY